MNKVLEPVSVLHLDMSDDVIDNALPDNSVRKDIGLLRHGSMGAGEDPGVIGPVVWHMHRERLQHGISFSYLITKILDITFFPIPFHNFDY